MMADANTLTLTLSTGGDVFLLEMGEPILIKDLAENMIQLAGFEVRDDDHPEGDIEISVVGARPGEKLYEELFYDPSAATVTRHSKILRAPDAKIGGADIDGALADLKTFIADQNEAAARALLFDFIR